MVTDCRGIRPIFLQATDVRTPVAVCHAVMLHYEW